MGLYNVWLTRDLILLFWRANTRKDQNMNFYEIFGTKKRILIYLGLNHRTWQNWISPKTSVRRFYGSILWDGSSTRLIHEKYYFHFKYRLSWLVSQKYICESMRPSHKKSTFTISMYAYHYNITSYLLVGWGNIYKLIKNHTTYKVGHIELIYIITQKLISERLSMGNTTST